MFLSKRMYLVVPTIWRILVLIRPAGVTQNELGQDASTDLAAFLFFQIAAGHIALPILSATLLIAKTVKRTPALLVLCVTWIVSGVCSTLLYVTSNGAYLYMFSLSQVLCRRA